MKNKSSEIVADSLTKSARLSCAFLKRHGCTPVAGHYSDEYFFNSGFFTAPNGTLWYWNSGDYRLPYGPYFRKALDLHDFFGKGDSRNRTAKTGEEFDRMVRDA